MDDVQIVQMLIDAYKAAVARWDDLPEIWPDDEALVALWEKLSHEKDEAAEALCFYRPTSLEGVHAKAEYMFGCADFIDQEANDDWTRSELISGFLPAGKDVTPWAESEEGRKEMDSRRPLHSAHTVLLSAVAENERERIRERIREVKRHLASQGIYGGGNPTRQKPKHIT
ncbi:hypothetical protein AM571_CH01747 [Rhizobium etli 8C-3]|uniref:Uncharacterized protein n=2 Tax=Rhizobium etli TaxID=29449 RepID=A0A1L5P365_RHIET|nr:hypothetical protein AM571_CH01747 [Rhizobium etli 8C-3]